MGLIGRLGRRAGSHGTSGAPRSPGSTRPGPGDPAVARPPAGGDARAAGDAGAALAPSCRVLDVPTGSNVRELGGLPTLGGGVTLTHRFLRSGSTSELDDADVEGLVSYGVRRVVDLRSEHECQASPDRLASRSGVAYLACPLLGHDVRDRSLGLDTADADWMCATYLGVLGNARAMRRIFSFMAQAPDDACVLFHCSAGMDRTGVLVAVVLGLCGVDRAHVLADYCASFVPPDAAEAILVRGESVDGVVGVDDVAGAMAGAWDRVMARFGDMHAYLRACGVSERDCRRVRRHLLGDGA